MRQLRYGGKMKITWYGAASLLIESKNDRIMIDPVKGLPGSENSPSWEELMAADNILLTSGKLDRIHNIPLIVNTSGATVYCTRTPAELLEKDRTNSDLIAVVKPGLSLVFGDISVNVYKGASDNSLVLTSEKHRLASPKVLRYPANAFFLRTHLTKFSDFGESLCYSICSGGKTILIPGSLGLDADTDYPKYVDMLVLPYQGNDELITDAVSLIDRICPRTVLLDMFDNYYPPMTDTTSTKGLHKALQSKYPDLPVVKPRSGKPVTLL